MSDELAVLEDLGEYALEELEDFEDLGEYAFEELEDFEDLGEYAFEELEDFEDLGEYAFEELEDFEDLSDFEEFEFADYEDLEADPFLGKLWRGVKRGLKRVGKWVWRGAKALAKRAIPIFKKLAPIAARIVGGVIGGPVGAKIGGTIAGAVLREAAYESEAEAEAEIYESEGEFEEEGGDLEAYELMEEYAAEAAEAETAAEADMFMGRMFVQATRMFRRNRRVIGAIRHVVRAGAALAKTFRANRSTRWAIKTIPLIVRRTLTRLARLRRRITRQDIVKAMARETAWVLANRRRAMAALRRHKAVRRRTPTRRLVPRRRPVRRLRPLSYY